MKVIGDGRYELYDDVLGEGSFGKVHLGRSCFGDKEEVAVKVINKKTLSSHMRQRLATELQIHRRVTHDNIVKMHDVVDEGDTMYLVMEKLDSDMFDFVIDNGRLQENLVRRLFFQLCQALSACHKLSIIHHDVKLENCMLKRQRDSKGKETGLTLKLVDFGLSCLSPAGQKLQTFSGTEAYCAAEILAGRPYDGRLIDAYSAGVFLYICLTGAYPFSQDLEVQHKEQVDLRYLSALPFPQAVSKDAQGLVLHLLQPSPDKRAKIDDILEHPFFVGLSSSSRERESAQPGTESDIFMFQATDDEEEFVCEAIPTCTFEPTEEMDHWEEDEWNALSEEFAEAGVSWEDRLTPDCHSL